MDVTVYLRVNYVSFTSEPCTRSGLDVSFDQLIFSGVISFDAVIFPVEHTIVVTNHASCKRTHNIMKRSCGILFARKTGSKKGTTESWGSSAN